MFQFDMFAKMDVNGANADPLWTFLKEAQPGFLVNAIKWNFTKFLVNPDGQTVERVAPRELPETLRARIETTLMA